MLRELPQVKKGTRSVKGFIFTQILKKREGYIYEVKTINGIHYEVFKSRQKRVTTPFEERMYPGYTEYEIYPGDEDFGHWAWCIKDKRRAIEKYNEL